MEPDGGQNSSEYVGKHATFKLMGNFSSIHIIRKRRRAVDEDDHYCSKRKHSVRMLFSHRLVAFISCILLCLIPDPVRTFPFDGSLVEGASGSLSNSHRSHMDLLIDPIHQAEYGDEELESKKVVAKSVFDMVLRTPPPPTSSSTRCPPGTQSPFEGGPCIKKSTDPVALVDQTFLLDTLRGLTRDGVLLGGGSSRTRRPGGGGGHNRRRPTGRTKMPTTATTATTIKTTTQPPTTTMTTEIPPETTFMRDVSDSALSEVRQPYDSSIDMIPESLNSYVTTDNPKSLDIISVEDHVRSGDDNFSDERKADSGLNIDEITLITTSATTDNESDTDQEMTTLSLPTEIPTAIMKDYPEIGINDQIPVSTSTSGIVQGMSVNVIGDDRIIQSRNVTSSNHVESSNKILSKILIPAMLPTTSSEGQALTDSHDPSKIYDVSTKKMQSVSTGTFMRKGLLVADPMVSHLTSTTLLEESEATVPIGAVEEFITVTEDLSSTSLSSNLNNSSSKGEAEEPLHEEGGDKILVVEPNMNRFSDNIPISYGELSTSKYGINEGRVWQVEQQMLTTKDKNMTTAQPATLEQKEQSGYVGDDDHPSSIVVNHLTKIGLVGNEPENKDGEKVAANIGIKGAYSTVDDLVIVNNHTVSLTYHPVQEMAQQKQFLVNDGEIIHPRVMSSSSREKAHVQQVFTEIESSHLSSPLIPPATTESSPLQLKDELYQFQLPIVSTKGPIVSNSFQSFQEFPSSFRKFNFPDNTAGGHYANAGTVFRGTLRPLLVHGFYPGEFLRTETDRRSLEKNPPANYVSFKEQKQQEWQTLKPFPSTTSLPTAFADIPQSSPVLENEKGSTEYLESELDRRHQKARSRNRIKYSESTNQPVTPEFVQTFYSSSIKSQQQQEPLMSVPSQQQPLYYTRRNHSSDFITSAYLNVKNEHGDRTNNSRGW